MKTVTLCFAATNGDMAFNAIGRYQLCQLMDRTTFLPVFNKILNVFHSRLTTFSEIRKKDSKTNLPKNH